MAKALTEKQENAITTPIQAPDLIRILNIDEDTLAALDYTALPTIRFDGEVFKVRDADWTIDAKKGFECVILQATPLTYYRGPDNHAVQGVYSYDDETTTAGEPLQDIFDVWKQDGVRWQAKKYYELKVYMISPGDATGELALVSISPTSRARFKAYVDLKLGLKMRKHPRAVVTRMHANPQKVTGSNGRQYSTWAFDYVRDYLED